MKLVPLTAAFRAVSGLSWAYNGHLQDFSIFFQADLPKLQAELPKLQADLPGGQNLQHIYIVFFILPKGIFLGLQVLLEWGS